ncbi:MAG: hypothetical protein IT374_15025 [Polyangiaceae bacterium]|nr:hypothetical protein [Polyangiaceae bacterium]
MSTGIPSFSAKDTVDEPGIIGASWWQDGLDPLGRRPFLRSMLLAGGALALGATIVSAVMPEPGFTVASRASTQTQRDFGWSFGAEGEALVFDGVSTQAFDRGALSRLGADARPRSARLAPFFVPTLFEALTSTPTQRTEDSSKARPLVEALRPIFTASMDRAYAAGAALAKALGGRLDVAALVDLPGPDAVAFAAGAAGALEPVFAFDNWPHPRGVVPAPLTLGALAYYQPRWGKAAASRNPAAAPMFALDRARLSPYVDDSRQFDNRHLARVPSPAALSGLGVRALVHVVPGAGDLELDDLNDDLVKIAAALKLFLRSLALVESPPSGQGPTDGATYAPAPRRSPYSSGTAGGARTQPAGFGMVPVLLAAGTGAVIGAKISRNGSLFRGGSTGG